jgi:hypothetical protein
MRGIPKMKYWGALAVALGVCFTSADTQSDSGNAAKAVATAETETKYLLVHQEAGPRFITSNYTLESQRKITKKVRLECNSSSIRAGAFARLPSWNPPGFGA